MFWVAMFFTAIFLVARVGEEVTKVNKWPAEKVKTWDDFRKITWILAFISSVIATIIMVR